MSTVDFGNPDVIVIGAGNAACCAALAARESGASVIMLEAAPLDDCGGNSRYTAGAVRIVFNGVDDLVPALRPDRRREEKRRLRHLHRRPVLRRHGTHHQLPHRSGSVRDPGEEKLRDHGLDAQEGREISAVVRAPGVQGRRPLQVLGRPRGRDLGRRPGPDRTRAQGVRARRHHRFITKRRPTALHHRRQRRQGRAREDARAAPSTSAPRRWCSPAADSNRMPKCARAISAPTGISPRCAARATTPVSASRAALAPARYPTATGRAATRWAGTRTRRRSATSPSATTSRNTAIRWASWSMRTASASSTKARTSAITPTPSTAR